MKAFPWGKVPEERGRMRESKQAYPHPSRACVRRASHLPPREGFAYISKRLDSPILETESGNFFFTFSYYFLIKILIILIRKASPEGAACFVIYKERNHKTSLI